ncbi:ATP synthase subunit delta [Echinicola pacifica]|uniref:ATP synthase subunit delta n=1 Tax=Echinicola pacifica TaxID=346377 RepID=A0A918PU27_9BACT|nr:ATP synthase F1 subunit delta [Echinicola pacifica]GGZ23229.1 ATP synthase subunit delta [Echinicola pacifica]
MSVTRVASRYAKALLGLAVEQGVLNEVHQDMQQLLKVVKENRDFALLLKSPIVTADVKAKIINQIFTGSAQDLTLKFYSIISRKKRENLLADIAKQFLAIYNDHEGIQKAVVTTTFPIGDELRKVFAEAVKEISGKPKVELVEKIDKDIIGGFVLKVDDRQIDDSLSSKLKSLKLHFLNNQFEKQI